MIVRPLQDDLLLITQVDHAALAGRLMMEWRADGFPERPRRARVLEATSHHDFGWLTVDASPRIDPETGAPYGFVNAPLEVRQGVWQRALAHLGPQDPYVAALVAHHAATVYRRYLHTPGWETLFPDLERRRDALLATQGIAVDDDFLRDYAIVGVGDLCSLAFCDAWQEPQSRAGYQVTVHAAVTGMSPADAATVQGGWLQVSPDPFGGATVPLEVSARRVPARRYASDEDLRETVANAPGVRLIGTAAGAPPPPRGP